MKISLKPIVCILGAAFFISCGGTLPQVIKFDTRPQAPFRGDTVLIEWVVRGAEKVTLDGITVPDSGGMKVLLDKSRDFTLIATAPHAEMTKKLEIVAQPK